MLLKSKHEESLDMLEERLRLAEGATSELVSDVTTIACGRFRALGAASKVDRLMGAGAWTDTALALLELELPQWKLRRLVKDDGEWLCTLSKQPSLPLGYDEVAEASHESLPLAILIALLQARRASANTAGVNTVPLVRPASGDAVCCENFS